MTPRQRVWQAIRHMEPDRVPWQIGCTTPARRKLQEYFGTQALDEVLGNHLAKYRPRAPDALVEVRPGYWRDEFGVVWNRTVDPDIGVVEVYPLRSGRWKGLPGPTPTIRGATPPCRSF